MADQISLSVSIDGIGNKLKAMLDKGGLVRGWLNRVAYPKIIEAQNIRWASEGASEGKSWAPLNPNYQRLKLRKFADYPGSGTKMLVATGRLVDGMTGKSDDSYKLVEETRIYVGVVEKKGFEYPKWVNEKRDFTTLGEDTIEALKADLNEYIAGA